MCSKTHFSASEYFDFHDKTYDCKEYYYPGQDSKIITITTEVKGVPQDMISKINDGYVRFEMQAGPGTIFHFVQYKIWSYWDFYEKHPTAYSLTEGFIAPSDFSSDNSNLTLAFKGQHETIA